MKINKLLIVNHLCFVSIYTFLFTLFGNSTGWPWYLYAHWKQVK